MRPKHLHQGARQPVSVADTSRPRDKDTLQGSPLHGRPFHRPFNGYLDCHGKLFATDELARPEDVGAEVELDDLAFSSNLGTIGTAKYRRKNPFRRAPLPQDSAVGSRSAAAGRRGHVKDSMGCIIPIRDANRDEPTSDAYLHRVSVYLTGSDSNLSSRSGYH